MVSPAAPAYRAGTAGGVTFSSSAWAGGNSSAGADQGQAPAEPPPSRPAEPATASAGYADSGREAPVSEPAPDGSGYQPAQVSFAEEDEDYGSKPGYDVYDRERDTAPASSTPSWKDSGRPGGKDKVFDVTAGRRRPVVFEEEDDLDVPDFLK